MITINNIKELEKYKFQTISKKYDGEYKVYLYKFMENNELADVEFNVEIPFGFIDFQNEDNVKMSKCTDENELPEIVEFAEPICYTFWANNIVANKKFRVGRVYANNIKLNDTSEIFDKLHAKGKVEANILDCEINEIVCGEIVCEDLIVDNIICGKLQAKSLTTNNCFFENIIANNVNGFYEKVKSND